MNRSFLRKLIMAIIDIAIINIALLLAFYLRFDGADRYVGVHYTYPVVTLLHWLFINSTYTAGCGNACK